MGIYFHPAFGPRTEVLDLYAAGKSAAEIKDELDIPVTVRSIQRYLNKHGVSRTAAEAQKFVKEKRSHSLKKYWETPEGRRRAERLGIAMEWAAKD